MKPPTILIVAGEPSGDLNAATLVKALAEAIPGAKFIGAGGPKMAEAGVPIIFDLTTDATIGPIDALKKLGTIRRRQCALADLANSERPEIIVLVDFYSFNHPWLKKIRGQEEWSPKIVQYTSPQVWASRPGRAEKMAKDIDLLLCFFPFEKEWYAKRGTPLRVEFVGHPIFDRYPTRKEQEIEPATEGATIVLLPGSRTDELKRHLPVLLGAARLIFEAQPCRFKVVAPDDRSAAFIRASQVAGMPKVEVQVGNLAEALSTATLAITKTGTITLECAYFGVPTLAIYKTSWLFYWLARLVVSVNYLAMPNILANEPVFPEFIQKDANAESLANAALQLLSDPARRAAVRSKLRGIIDSLGGPGSAKRAAQIIAEMRMKNDVSPTTSDF